MSTVTRWIPVEALADYFDVPFVQVHAELQQRHLLGEIDGVVLASEEQAHGWAERSYGVNQAAEMLSGFEAFSFDYPEREVALVDEVTATDGDYPYLL